jgi:hypothetical protein
MNAESDCEEFGAFGGQTTDHLLLGLSFFDLF